MDAALRRMVRTRAGGRCEYCGIMEEATPVVGFHVDHIVARQHGGTDEGENLAYSCYYCNRHKGPNLSGIDPETGSIMPLFHPRLDHWDEHFTRRGSLILGLTPRGRATVRVLAMNDAIQQEARSESE